MRVSLGILQQLIIWDLVIPPPLSNAGQPVPSPTAATRPGEEWAAETILVCSVLRRDEPPSPLIYGHWYNSFNMIYLTAEKMANAWRMIGHAGFVHF